MNERIRIILKDVGKLLYILSVIAIFFLTVILAVDFYTPIKTMAIEWSPLILYVALCIDLLIVSQLIKNHITGGDEQCK